MAPAVLIPLWMALSWTGIMTGARCLNVYVLVLATLAPLTIGSGVTRAST